MNSNRIQRVNQLIKREISQLLLKEIDFPPKTLTTVTRAETSVDLKQAKVYISVIPKEKISEVTRILNNRIFEIQQKINKRLTMRPVPRIQFIEEKKTAEASRIEELLEKIKKQK